MVGSNGQQGRVRYEEFGLESVMRSHHKFVKNRNDVLVVWLHYCLLRNLYKTHGGEGALTEDKTEHLPRSLGWNGERRMYLLKYEHSDRLFALGIHIRDHEADCSLVSVTRSLRIGIPVQDLVRDDLSIRDNTCDEFTEIVELTCIRPMAEKAGFGGGLEQQYNYLFPTAEAEMDSSFVRMGDLKEVEVAENKAAEKEDNGKAGEARQRAPMDENGATVETPIPAAIRRRFDKVEEDNLELEITTITDNAIPLAANRVDGGPKRQAEDCKP